MNKSDFIFKYRIRTWREYNRALVRHGSIALWVDEQALAAWRNEEPSGRRARPRIYTHTAIECALVVRAVFQLSLRAAQGLLASVLSQ